MHVWAHEGMGHETPNSDSAALEGVESARTGAMVWVNKDANLSQVNAQLGFSRPAFVDGIQCRGGESDEEVEAQAGGRAVAGGERRAGGAGMSWGSGDRWHEGVEDEMASAEIMRAMLTKMSELQACFRARNPSNLKPQLSTLNHQFYMLC